MFLRPTTQDQHREKEPPSYTFGVADWAACDIVTPDSPVSALPTQTPPSEAFCFAGPQEARSATTVEATQLHASPPVVDNIQTIGS